VLACLYLDKYGPVSGYISVREIGRRLQIPYSYLSKIIQLLSSKGVVKTKRGSGGGIALDGASSQILVKSIIEAVEGPIIVPDSFIEQEEHTGSLQFMITIDEWTSLKEQIENMFNTLTLDRLSSITQVSLTKCNKD
jgi:Rrf2 family iron-sulfur cluster assembly transcriptional regulator